MTTSLKAAAMAGAFFFSIGTVGSADASTPVTIYSTGIYNPATITVGGALGPTDDWSTAVEFSVAVDGGVVQTLYGFCVDLTHVIYVNYPGTTDIVTAGGNNQYNNTLNYTTSTLSRDSVGGPSGSSGVVLSSLQIGEIGGLANFGRNLILTADPSSVGFSGQYLSDELAAVQGAIWSIEYPTSTFTAQTTSVQSLLNTYIADAPAGAVSGPVNTIYNGVNQGFVVGSSQIGRPGDGESLGNFTAVPEPTSWMLMIGGFGFAGAMLRRRQALALAA